MKEYRVKLVEMEKIARATVAFHFQKPRGFKFIPGQYMQIFLDRDHHDFSIASAPHDKFLTFATRMRKNSSFKNKLAGLKEGDKITLRGPAGQFALPEKIQKPIALLVGGIGITPARSMLRHAARQKSNKKMYLFHSNRTPKDAPWFDEFQKMESLRFRFIPTMTGRAGRGWRGEAGYINFKMIAKYLKKPRNSLYYVVGPPRFVDSMMKILTSVGISRRAITSEEFAGYL